MSDLRESEEAKLEKILGHTLNKSPRKPERVSMNLTNRSSLGDVLKEVLDDLDVQSASDLDDDDSIKLDELLKRSSSPRKKSVSKRVNRGESTRRSVDPKPPSDMTLEMTAMKQRKVSPIVRREKEMCMRREAEKEKFAEKRQEAAKKLLREMISDELILPTGKSVFFMT